MDAKKKQQKDISDILQYVKDKKLPCKRVHGYDVYFEKSETGFSCFCPTLLGCVSAGDTITECKRHMKEAIELHLEGMIEDGETPPPRDWRGEPRPNGKRGRTVSVSSRVSPEIAKTLDAISRKQHVSKTEALEMAILEYGKSLHIKASK